MAQRNSIALIGATGNVGRICVELLLQKKLLTPSQLKLYASNASKGKKLQLAGYQFVVQSAAEIEFDDVLLCLFATESAVSKIFVPQALAKGVYVIDSSSFYRLDPSVPLIVPPVNKELISVQNDRLYAIANCVAAPIAVVLAPLLKMLRIKRVAIVTYQSTSGAGKGPMDELLDETTSICQHTPHQRQYFTRQIAFNVIPQIDQFLDDGSTFEEFKMMKEILKITADTFAITATAVRVPVMIGHSVALSIEFERDFVIDDIQNALRAAVSIKLSPDHYTTPIEVEGEDDVYVGRIRRDPSVPFGIHLWMCSDNLRRGAATDAVEVAEEILKQLHAQSV